MPSCCLLYRVLGAHPPVSAVLFGNLPSHEKRGRDVEVPHWKLMLSHKRGREEMLGSHMAQFDGCLAFSEFDEDKGRCE